MFELEDCAKFLRRIAKTKLPRALQAMSDGASPSPAVVRFGDVTLDRGQRRAWRGTGEVELPKLSFDLLTALVEAAPNSLSTDELMDEVWNGSVVSPATIAKRVELVREALGDDSHEPHYIGLVRGHGYRLIPEVRDVNLQKRRSRTALSAAAVFALIALTGGVALYLAGDGELPPEKSVAVLPFVSMTTEPGGEVFADGLTEELSHTLARIADLKVAGRTSSFYFKGRNEDLRVIGETLGVAHILEGSVRQSSGALRVTAQLINAADGFHLWSESYDRPMSDIIVIQKDIAVAVAQKLQASMSDDLELDELTDVIGPEAYALYLKAVSLSPYGKTRDLGEAQALAEQVTTLAPEFAPGWNRLAAIHGRRLISRDTDYDLAPEESLRVGLAAVDKALSLDPLSGEAYANLGGAAWAFERDEHKAAPLIERALELDPWNLDIVSFAADFAKYAGHLDDALKLEELLIARDPLCDLCRHNLARSYVFLRRYDDAEKQYQTLKTIHGGYDWTLGILQLLQQQPELALASFRRHTGTEYFRPLGEGMALHDLGQVDEAATILNDASVQWGDEVPYDVARAYAYVGEVDAAFRWLERSLPAAALPLQTSFSDPLFDSLRDDPRWRSLLERIGRTPEQLETIPLSLHETIDRLGL